jgi:DNA-binding response OmpR family regulator
MVSKILLVDDDPNLLAAMGRGLRKQFELDTAATGKRPWIVCAPGGRTRSLSLMSVCPKWMGSNFCSVLLRTA